MVLTLGVIIEESSAATSIGNVVRSRDSFCNRNSEDTYYPDSRNKYCNKLKKAHPWYYILLFVTDVVLVLCFFVTLILFADWILFIAPVRISLIYGSFKLNSSYARPDCLKVGLHHTQNTNEQREAYELESLKFESSRIFHYEFLGFWQSVCIL